MQRVVKRRTGWAGHTFFIANDAPALLKAFKVPKCPVAAFFERAAKAARSKVFICWPVFSGETLNEDSSITFFRCQMGLFSNMQHRIVHITHEPYENFTFIDTAFSCLKLKHYSNISTWSPLSMKNQYMAAREEKT